jgi:hypothetical protein
MISSKKDKSLCQDDLPPVLIGQSSLARIRELAVREPEMVFTSLVHRIDLSLLKQCFRQVRKSKSCGVDKGDGKEVR